MWREKGQGEFYTYLPPYTDTRFAANKKQCNVAPSSDCNPTYGASIGRGAFKFATGGWTTVTERVRLNDVGKANGEIELFVNGKSEISVKGLILRARSAGRIRGIQMQSFFGGMHHFLRSCRTVRCLIYLVVIFRQQQRMGVTQRPGCLLRRLVGCHYRKVVRTWHGHYHDT
jgi:hypothetical protein